MNNKLSDHGKVDKLETPKAPAPQASRRKSRGGEQMNFTLPQIATVATYNQTANISNFQKKKKHWRSPSNPIDFMNCIRSKNARQVEEVKECIEEITLLTYNTNISMLKTPNSKQASTSTRSPPALSAHNIAQLNFGTLAAAPSALGGIKSGMTVIKRQPILRHCSTSIALQSYETQLLRRPQGITFPMTAELSISPIVSSGNSSDYTSTRRHTFSFVSAYCHPEDSGTFDSTSLAHGHIDPQTQPQSKQVTFSRCSLLQLILRNPEDNSVAGIFVVKLELSDMPPDSRTILRQKAYKSKCLVESGAENSCDKATDYLAKFIEIPLKRIYDSDANRQRILLAGPIRVAYSFNRSNLRYTSPRRSDASAVEPVQKTRTVLQFPSASLKYFPLESSTKNVRSNSLTTDSLEKRSFPHGSLCL